MNHHEDCMFHYLAKKTTAETASFLTINSSAEKDVTEKSELLFEFHKSQPQAYDPISNFHFVQQ